MKTQCYIRQKLPVVLVAGLGGLFTVVDLACAQPWATTTAPNLSWSALASSADGTKLVAAANTRSYGPGAPAPIYISTNAGATWTPTTAPSNNWSSVASSADGARLVAVAATQLAWTWNGTNDEYLVVHGTIHSSLDSGATWTQTSAPTNYWTSVASSADGARLMAVAAPEWIWNGTNYHSVGDGRIYSSSDSGATWTPTTAPSNYWTSVASSADGTRLVAVAAPQWVWDGTSSYSVGDGAVYRSLDLGATWSRTSAPTNGWSAIACSADGAKLVAVAAPYYDGNSTVGDGAIYCSLDSGTTWAPTSPPNSEWSAVTSSADGSKLVAASSYYDIYTSSDSGANWMATGLFSRQWAAVASSADGYRVVAGGYGTSLYTLPYAGLWRLADAPANGWNSVASSADGTKVVAVAWNSPICTSTNSGTTWAQTSAPTNYWTSIASSADGARLVAVASPESVWNGTNYDSVGDGAIYSSLDSGATWMPTTAPRNTWTSVASSADGARLVAVAIAQPWTPGSDGLIYTSPDFGVSWTRSSAPSNRWSSVASSADGVKLVAGAEPNDGGNGLIYTSGDSGVTWTPTSVPTNFWDSVASSADGTKLVAVAGSGPIYTSTNSGTSWTLTSAPTQQWWSVASSADGTALVAAAVFPISSIYTSANSGATWTHADAPAADSWYGVTSSADGSNIVAVGYDTIWTRGPPAPAPPLPPSPQLAVGVSGASVDLSWLVPSTRFVLQQNSDLSSTNWVEVPTPPTLDLTNLHQRLTLTPSLGSSFYRLKQQ